VFFYAFTFWPTIGVPIPTSITAAGALSKTHNNRSSISTRRRDEWNNYWSYAVPSGLRCMLTSAARRWLSKSASAISAPLAAPAWSGAVALRASAAWHITASPIPPRRYRGAFVHRPPVRCCAPALEPEAASPTPVSMYDGSARCMWAFRRRTAIGSRERGDSTDLDSDSDFVVIGERDRCPMTGLCGQRRRILTFETKPSVRRRCNQLKWTLDPRLSRITMAFHCAWTPRISAYVWGDHVLCSSVVW